jgi:hypothetical protein
MASHPSTKKRLEAMEASFERVAGTNAFSPFVTSWRITDEQAPEVRTYFDIRHQGK